ncbi:hypothetical protein N0V82_003194 [Gnomoniopsis sp. IMI 355080]|nr:hypothetical protein N0V82_003194 [Gnomoniopsis sp. IMI 355080]
MRFTTFILAVFSATSASAAAISAEKREADALCLFHGQGCWKRDAAPVPSVVAREADAEAEADPLCLFHGQGCWKREAEPEAEAEALCLFHGQGCWKEKRDAVPEPVADPLCLFHGQGCWKRDAEKREADALCLFHGQGCWKRDAAPEAAPEADPLCLFHGQGCWKREAEEKRTADPLCLFHGQGCWKREAAAEAAPEADPLCLFHGQGCWKRDAAPEPVADPLCLFHGQGCWKEKREAAPLPAPAADAEADPLCLFHGQGCWKREAAPEAAPEPSPEALCLFHGQGCWKVKRAVYAFANAVRSMGAAPETRAAAISNSVGGAAYNAKRATNEIAHLLAGRTTDPIKYLDNLYLVSFFGPDASINTTADEQSYKRSEVDRRLCLFHGQGCWKRDAAPGSEAGSAADKRACNAPGAACDIARRAAEALVGEIESFHAPEKRSDVLEERLCLFHGQGCWKRDTVENLVTRCNAPGGACDNAARDLKVMHTAARALLDYVNEE